MQIPYNFYYFNIKFNNVSDQNIQVYYSQENNNLHSPLFITLFLENESFESCDTEDSLKYKQNFSSEETDKYKKKL